MQIAEDGIQEITGRDGIVQPYECEIIPTKKQSLILGMETLLNAPLHTPQQKEKVSLKSLQLSNIFAFFLFDMVVPFIVVILLT